MQKLKNVSRFWPLLLGAVIGLAAGLAYTLVTPTAYTATSVLFLTSPASTDSIGAYQGDLFSQQRATTYVQLFGSDDLATKVIDDLGLKTTPGALKHEVVATQVPKTVLMTVAVTDTSRQRAADIANSYAMNFNDYVQRLETSRVTGTPTIAISIVNKAEPPKSPSSIGLPIALAIGLAAGLALAGFGLWGWRRWRTPQPHSDNSVHAPKREDDAATTASVPPVGPTSSVTDTATNSAGGTHQ